MNAPLLKKLGILEMKSAAIVGMPDSVKDFDGLEFDVKLENHPYDLVVRFVFILEEFKSALRDYVSGAILNPGGVLYFIYPKKGNRQYDTFIGRDDLLKDVDMDDEGYVSGSSVKFNRMAAFSDVFTAVGLKNVPVRPKKSGQPSQCVGDYIDRIPELEQRLSGNPAALDAFRKLTPGYRRGWARYVFGVKTEETLSKRLAEMEDLIVRGYKSIDLYRQSINK